MIYHWEATAALALVRDQQTSEPFTLTGEGLWVCLLSSGSCTAALGDAPGSLPALPPKPVEAGGQLRAAEQGVRVFRSCMESFLMRSVIIRCWSFFFPLREDTLRRGGLTGQLQAEII